MHLQITFPFINLFNYFILIGVIMLILGTTDWEIKNCLYAA